MKRETLLNAISDRHSVRQYENIPIPDTTKRELQDKIDQLNEESGLHMQLVTEEPEAFSSMMAKYGSFKGVTNYIAMVGPKGKDLEEKAGYYGEQLVLFAQTLGLNTCWVAMTYSKRKARVTVDKGEELVFVIALGYGVTQGTGHKIKTFDEVVVSKGPNPEWFVDGVNAALLAPTAMNQQKFTFALDEDTVTIKPGTGFYSKADMGIVKYHFELGAGGYPFKWAK